MLCSRDNSPLHYNFFFFRKIIETLTKEESNLLSRLETQKVDNLRSGRLNDKEKQFVEMTKIYEKYLAKIKEKQNAIGKLQKKLADLRIECEVRTYNDDIITTRMNESIEKSALQVQQLQDKLYNVSIQKY